MSAYEDALLISTKFFDIFPNPSNCGSCVVKALGDFDFRAQPVIDRDDGMSFILESLWETFFSRSQSPTCQSASTGEGKES